MNKKGKYDFDFTGRSVLVVEDTFMSFKLIDTVLNQVNASVTHASDALKAIELCSGDQDFDLVLMDIQLPGMNGIMATKEIKKIRPHLPVIAATANTFDNEEKACREAGCEIYLTKPLQFKKLFELMQIIFDRQS